MVNLSVGPVRRVQQQDESINPCGPLFLRSVDTCENKIPVPSPRVIRIDRVPVN